MYKFSDRSVEVEIPAILENYDGPANQQTDQPTNQPTNRPTSGWA